MYVSIINIMYIVIYVFILFDIIVLCIHFNMHHVSTSHTNPKPFFEKSHKSRQFLNLRIFYVTRCCRKKNTKKNNKHPMGSMFFSLRNVRHQIFWSDEVARKIEGDFKALPEAPKHDQAVALPETEMVPDKIGYD